MTPETGNINVNQGADNPLDINNVLKNGINGLSLQQFLRLSGMYKDEQDLPYANSGG